MAAGARTQEENRLPSAERMSHISGMLLMAVGLPYIHWHILCLATPWRCPHGVPPTATAELCSTGCTAQGPDRTIHPTYPPCPPLPPRQLLPQLYPETMSWGSREGRRTVALQAFIGSEASAEQTTRHTRGEHVLDVETLNLQRRRVFPSPRGSPLWGAAPTRSCTGWWWAASVCGISPLVNIPSALWHQERALGFSCPQQGNQGSQPLVLSRTELGDPCPLCPSAAASPGPFSQHHHHHGAGGRLGVTQVCTGQH